MSDTTFVNGVTLSDADWFNDVNRVVYTILVDPATAIAALDALKVKGADKASAATVDLSTATGDFVHITGTTTITALTISSGDERTVVFDGILTLTHNATTLILPGAANITTAVGDTAIFRGDGSGNTRCIAYIRGAAAYITASSTDTLTNKTVTNPANTDQTLTDGATINWDMNLGGIATVTLGGNRTMAAPTNLKKGTYVLYVIQDATGSRTITWNSVFKWAGASAPILTTTAAAKDLLTFVCDGTNLYGAVVSDVR